MYSILYIVGIYKQLFCCMNLCLTNFSVLIIYDNNIYELLYGVTILIKMMLLKINSCRPLNYLYLMFMFSV